MRDLRRDSGSATSLTPALYLATHRATGRRTVVEVVEDTAGRQWVYEQGVQVGRPVAEWCEFEATNPRPRPAGG